MVLFVFAGYDDEPFFFAQGFGCVNRFVEEFGEFFVVEADGSEVEAFGAEGIELAGEGVVVPIGQLGGAIVGDGEGGGVGAGKVGADDVDGFPAKGFSGGERAVAGSDDAVGAGQRLAASSLSWER